MQNSTLIEAPAKRESCLMCWPCLPMMAPTDRAGINRCTVSVSDCCRGRKPGCECSPATREITDPLTSAGELGRSQGNCNQATVIKHLPKLQNLTELQTICLFFRHLTTYPISKVAFRRHITNWTAVKGTNDRLEAGQPAHLPAFLCFPESRTKPRACAC